jgi:O-acetyl-ADP-ribose deacetylase (regulator of RNase III)
MISINYIEGNVLEPIGSGIKYITHICNNKGGWGKGFVLEISKKWKLPEKLYRARKEYKLGDFDVCPTSDRDIWVVNMIARNGYKTYTNPHPCCLKSLTSCLSALGTIISTWNSMDYNISVHMPRIGCTNGGATWDEIEPIILQTLISKNINVTVYDK